MNLVNHMRLYFLCEVNKFENIMSPSYFLIFFIQSWRNEVPGTILTDLMI